MRRTVAQIVALASLLVVGLFVLYGIKAFETDVVTYSEFKTLVEQGQLDNVTFSGDTIVAERKDSPEGERPHTVSTVAVPNDTSLVTLLQAKAVPYGAVEAQGCGSASLLVAFALTMGMAFMVTRPNNGVPPGVATFGKSQAKLAPEEGTGVSFDDVAGIDEAEEELNEIVQFLKTPERFTRLGGRIPKGVLLIGPPGTGKTLLARAVAGEAGVPFFSLSGSDFVEMFVGVGASRVRDLFKQAAERAPCIIFIDELDAIGKSRGAGGPIGGHDEREQTLNQLLVEMDGFDGRRGIIIMAATNRPETLDAALLRAGRFDRQVVVDRPDVKGREAILRVHARNMTIGAGVDLKQIAQRIPGFSGADIAAALNDAALLAARRGKDAIGFDEIDEAVERMALGVERKSRRLTMEERRMTAYHEAGHAVCGVGMPGAPAVQKISIIPRGFTGGVTRFLAPEGRISMTRSEMCAQLTIFYGGMAAEEEFINEMSTGAKNDIAQASDIARRMVSEYGMSERLGPINYGTDRPNPFGMGPAVRDVAISDETAREIDAEVRRILDEALEQARTIVRQNHALIEKMADALIETETLDGAALADFLSGVRRLDIVRAGAGAS